MIQLVKRLDASAWFAIGNTLVALTVGLALFAGLPVRPGWAAAFAAALIAVLAASSAALLQRTRSVWFDRITIIAGIFLLITGVAVTAAVTLAMTFARAVGGPGSGPGRFY